MYLICRFRKWHKDILDPGVSWYLVDADSPEQTEFKAHKDWCHVIMMYQRNMREYIEKDTKVNAEEWAARPSRPLIQMMIIEGRKMEELPKGPDYYQPPGVDFFG